MTTLSHRNQLDSQKNVVYAYPSLKDATESQIANLDPRVMALPVPVVHILFQLLAMKSVDSLIFCETLGQNGQRVEVRRQELESLVQSQLQETYLSGVTPPADRT